MFGIGVSTFAYIAMIVVALIVIGGALTAGLLSIEQRSSVVVAAVTLLAYVAWRAQRSRKDDGQS